MAPIDWNEIDKCNLQDINDDLAKSFYKKLINFNPSNGDDPKRLHKLFLVSKAVLQLKGLQAEVAMEELEQMAKNQGRLSARHEKELLAEIEDLKDELENVKGSRKGSDTSLLKHNLRNEELEQENLTLTKEIESKKTEIWRTKREFDKALEMVEKQEEERSVLRDEIEKLQEQLEESKETIKNVEVSKEESCKMKEKELLAKIKVKNAEIHQLLNDIMTLESENSELRSQKSQLHEKLIEAVDQMEKTTDEYIKLKEAYGESESQLKLIMEQKMLLASEIEDLKSQLSQKGEVDDEIMETVSRRVQEWKTVLMSKEEEILRQQQLISKLQSEFNLGSMNVSESQALKKVVEDREAQIEVLKEQLQLATRDLEENSKLLEELRLNKNEESAPLSPGSRLGAMIESQHEIREKNVALEKLRNKLKVVEEEWKMKDQELSDTLGRMRLYEMGEYGLSEAVMEIKECKNQIRIRNKQIEELNQQINDSDFKLGEVVEENIHLREKLNISPRKYDSKSFRKSGSQKIQTVAQTLQEKVDALEGENVDLRTELHKIKRNSAKRSLTVSEDTNKIKKSKSQEVSDNNNEIEASYDRDELDSILETIEKVRLENGDLRIQLINFERENKSLFMGMKEILEALKEEDGKADVVLKCPTLEQLVAAIEVREIAGCYDPIWILKCQVDQLQGQNEALRGELKIIRQQAISSMNKLNKAEDKLRTMGNSPFSPTNSRLSEASEIHADVKSDKISVSKASDKLPSSPIRSESEISNRSDVDMSEGEVMTSPTHQSHNTASVPLLYKNILSEWEKFHSEKRTWTEECEREMQVRDTLKTRLEAFENLILTLEKDEDEMKKALAEAALKDSQLVCRVNFLSRRLEVSAASESDLRKENEAVKKELLSLELNSLEKIKYLLRYKERAHSKVLNLQKALDDSIPATELEIANRSFLDLNTNYQKLLQKQNEDNSRFQEYQEKEELTKKLKLECDKLKIDNRLLNEKVKILENDASTDEAGLQNELRVTLLKEANERQRADHLLLQHEPLKQVFDSMDTRNSELEKKFAELTREAVDIKNRERILKEKLNDCVSNEVYNALNAKVSELECKELRLREDADRYKAALESAKYQIQTVERFREVTEKELEMTRNLLLDMQASSDEKLSSGNLHRQIIGFQLSETKLQQELNAVKQKLDQSEKRNQNLQKKCVDKEDEVYNIHSQARSKIQLLTRILYELRRQFSSSIPIVKQEELMKEVKNLNNERNNLRKELEKVKEENSKIDEDKMKLSVKLQSAKELIQTLQSGSSVEKIMDWHKRIEVVQMREIHSKRLAERYSSQSDTLKELVNRLEAKILRLEEQNLRLESQLREQELEIDARNLDFLGGLSSNRLQSVSTRSEAREPQEELVQIEESLNGDSIHEQQALNDLPLEEDSVLSEALESSVSASEVRALRETVANLERRLKEAEDALKSREEALNDLIARMPTSLNTAPSLQTPQSPEVQLVDYFEAKQNLSVAQTTIDCLQARLNQKEESITRYQELLNKLKDDTVSQKLHYERELLQLQSKLQSAQRDYVLSKTKSASDADDKKLLMQELNSSLLSKVTELEESMDISQTKLSGLMKQLNVAQQETLEWKIKANNLTEKLEEEQERTKQELYLRLQGVEEIKRHQQMVQVLNRNFEEQIGNQPAQVIQLKLILKDLKNQIYGKEKQLNELINAIGKLRSEMQYMRRTSIKQADTHESLSQPDRSMQSINQVQFDKPETVAKIETKDEETQTSTDLKYKDYQDKIHNLQKVRENLKKQINSRDERISELAVELDALRMNSDQNDDFLEKTLKENEDMKRRLERARPPTSNAPVEENGVEEVSELKEQIRFLEELIRRHEPPEKPYVEDEKAQKSREELIRWEESKKWQQTTERLKSKLKEKEHEVESLDKSNKTLRDQLIKLNKERTLLENRVKALLVKAHPPELAQVEELKKKLQQLEQKTTGRKPDELEELKTKNKIFVDKIYQLEKQLAKYTVSRETMARATRDIFNDDPSVSSSVKINNLQKHARVLKLSEENFELKVELEQLKIDVPRYKVQISTLEGLINVLKSDLKNKEAIIEQLSNGEQSNIKEPKILDQSQSDINDNNVDKSDKTATPKCASSASIHRLLDVKTNKIASENMKLQHEVKKCQREIDQLSKRNRTLTEQNRRVLDALEEKEKLIQSLKQQIPTPHSMPPRQYKTYVVTKMYEEKISGLEKELEELKNKYHRVFTVTKEQAEKEERLRMEIAQLKIKIESLEKFSMVDPEDAIKALKEKNVELENENQELLGRLLHHEPELIKTKERDTIYETLLRENAEMRVQIRINELKEDT